MDDAAALAALRAGNPAGFRALYDEYFDRIYDFVFHLVRRHDASAEVTQATFAALAEDAGTIDPTRLRAWLYGVARTRALARAQAQPPASPGARALRDDHSQDALRPVTDEERVLLVWAAADEIGLRDFSLLDAMYRQGLDTAELADVLGVTEPNAQAMLDRLRQRFETALGGLLLARRAARVCDDLGEIVGVDPAPSAELINRVWAHAGPCVTCVRARQVLPSPAQLLAGMRRATPAGGARDAIFAALAPLIVPAAAEIPTAVLVPATQVMAASPYADTALTLGTRPRSEITPEPGGRVPTWVWVTGGAVVLALVVVAGVLVALSGGNGTAADTTAPPETFPSSTAAIETTLPVVDTTATSEPTETTETTEAGETTTTAEETTTLGPLPSVDTFALIPAAIIYGDDPPDLTWGTSRADTVFLRTPDGTTTAVSRSGNVVACPGPIEPLPGNPNTPDVCLAQPGEYTWELTASGPGGSTTESVTLIVDNIGPPVLTLTYEALPPSAEATNEVMLLFTIDGAYDSAVLTPPNGDPIEVDQLTEYGPLCADNMPPTPPTTQPTTSSTTTTEPLPPPACVEGTFLWTLTVTGQGGTSRQELEVAVPPPPPDTSTSTTA